jgi:hypothetical protein
MTCLLYLNSIFIQGLTDHVTMDEINEKYEHEQAKTMFMLVPVSAPMNKVELSHHLSAKSLRELRALEAQLPQREPKAGAAARPRTFVPKLKPRTAAGMTFAMHLF